MLCKFCQHEFDDSLTECPYCHRQVDFEPKSLTREERDSFSGTTIEIDGGDSGSYSEYQEQDSYRRDETFQRADRPYEEGRSSTGFKVYRLGGGLLTWIIFALIVVGIVFFLLPAFLIFAVVGAVAGAVIIFLSRLFQ
ncbi:MAG: hypothetical protein IJ056_08900 [Acidaminococcaceae bacterium]|nr:hypothetical protein [Acidaminococcaceae bacterium]